MAEVEKKVRKKTSTKYPKFSLMESLEIAKTIIDNNAGRSYDRLSLAESIRQSPGSSKFRMLIIASSKYGLTTGSYNAPKISLTPLASSILKPKSDAEKQRALKEALFNVDFYEKLFNMYNKNKIPAKEHFKNTLEREFEIPQDDTEQCYNLIMQNAKELNIIHKISGNLYFNLGLFGNQEIVGKEVIETIEEENNEVNEGKIESIEKDESKIKDITSEIEIKKISKPKIFIAHSKNKKILEQIKQILEFGQFEPIIAEEVETSAIPIPTKIFGLMRECHCAIINISADEQEKMPDGSYKINENVLIEIGASFLMYNQKVILLVDKRIGLPSNLQGLNKCEYEGNELSWPTGIKLTKVLQDFRKLD